jgi:hypothetical protein
VDIAELREGLQLSGAIRAIESCTWPWVIAVDFRFDRLREDSTNFEVVHERLIAVQASTMAEMPEAAELTPAGATFLKADVFPATKFDRMPVDVRDRYASHYRAYLLWRKSVAAEKHVDELVDGYDYSSRLIDESVARWVSYGFTEADE